MTNHITHRRGWTAVLLAVAAGTLPLCPVVAVAWADNAWSSRATVTTTGRTATVFPNGAARRTETAAQPSVTSAPAAGGTADPAPSASTVDPSASAPSAEPSGSATP